eukprot:GGOE01022866.1.p2 GENE.GGOE01022866.1~~GGOE01022866.1.p2  ORF type:complete len:324 (+),score=59.51 GGOE01022866.1:123-974(+)
MANASHFFNAPAWLTHTTLCPMGLPADLPRPAPGAEPMAFLDAYYHRALAVLSTVTDLTTVVGPALVVGGGLGGALPVLRHRLPALQRLLAIDLLPELVDVMRQRYGGVAECIVGDVFLLQDVVSPGCCQLVYSDICVEEYNQYITQAAHQIAAALIPGGLLLIGSSPHPVYCPQSSSFPHLTCHGLELVAQVPLTDDVLAAMKPAEDHLAASPDVGNSPLHRVLQDSFAVIQRLVRQRYSHSMCVFRKVYATSPLEAAANPMSNGSVGSAAGEDGPKYTERW